MGKQKAAPKPIDAGVVNVLVREKLLTLATVGVPMRLDTKKDADHPPLFPSKAGPSREARARCIDGEPPLLAVVGSGKAAQVKLTAAGFALIADAIPEEKIGGLAKEFAGEMPATDRIGFLQEIVRRTPLATAELLPVLEAAVAEEKAEAEARAKREAKRREAEAASLAALERWKATLEERKRQRIEALQKELAAEGANPDARDAEPKPRDHESPRPLVPTSREETDYRREVAGRLVSSWLESYRLNKPEGRLFLETAMANVDGLRQIGEEGEEVAFDGKYHECEKAVSTGSRVRVVQPGWVLEEGGGEHRLVPARVSP